MIQQEKKLADCSSLAEIKKYLFEKAVSHNNYKIYSTFDRIESIISDKKLYLYNGENWNDVDDGRNMQRDKDYNFFAKCFSFSISESIAMWMLYGGIQKRGAMLDINPKSIKTILDSSQISYGDFSEEKDNHGNSKFIRKGTLDSTQFEIYLVDVLYYGEPKQSSKTVGNDDKENLVIRRSNEIMECDIDLISQLEDDSNIFLKSYPWRYENECRFIIKVPKTVNLSGCSVVAIELNDEIINNLLERRYLSPNFSGGEISGYKLSKLNSKLNWDLCKGCTVKREHKK